MDAAPQIFADTIEALRYSVFDVADLIPAPTLVKRKTLAWHCASLCGGIATTTSVLLLDSSVRELEDETHGPLGSVDAVPKDGTGRQQSQQM